MAFRSYGIMGYIWTKKLVKWVSLEESRYIEYNKKKTKNENVCIKSLNKQQK